MKSLPMFVLFLVLIGSIVSLGQQTGGSVLGTVTSIKPDLAGIEVRPDNAPVVAVTIGAGAAIQRIAPGETTLTNATSIKASDLAIGDRVLVTLGANRAQALRIVVMSAGDIAKRDDAERQDWLRRGVSGAVAGRSGNEISLKTQQKINISQKTNIKRYTPDTVSIREAKPSAPDEISVGDSIRARGVKSADGLTVDAEEIIFGTFVTRAGTVTAIDAAAKQITVKELGGANTFTVKVAPESVIKQFPSVPAGRGASAAPSVSQAIDALPAAKLDDIKMGASIVVSSTKGVRPDAVTAILLVSNADALIRTGTPSGRGGTLVFGSASGGLDVLSLP